MERYSLRDAQQRPQKLMDDAQHGQTVLIVDENERAAQLAPVAVATRPRKAGSARGRVWMAPDFDAPLSDFDEHME